MDPTRHERLARLFGELCDLPRAEQLAGAERLAEGDAELDGALVALLDQDRDASGELDRPAIEHIEGGADALLSRGDPERVGPYRILGRLGAGGMGVVFEAEQEHPRRKVALKVVRGGLVDEDHLRRFEHEAQVLAWLSHPGIAQVYEAGTADTGYGLQPFFAMELVRGRTLTDYADEHGLDARGRLALVARVCDAVHHAHQKGVVHRDLKPSNILVEEGGQPKVLDFGVARVTHENVHTTLRTGAGELLGTLPYMSPEQVSGDPRLLDTRADVYALGVLTYRLLSGKLPIDVGRLPVPEAVRRIAEEDPTTLGVLDRRLRGDVEVIVAKAVEKDKERRYASAEELASDIRRFLNDEPIVARRATRRYQLAKFARRNRALVGGVVATIVALGAGSVASLVYAVRAEDARAAAVREAERARREGLKSERVSEFLIELFEQAGPSRSRGREVTAKEVLDVGVARVRTELADEPEVRARLIETMGNVYGQLGHSEEAVPLAEEAVALARETWGEDSLEHARALTRRASIAFQFGDYDTSRALHARSLELLERIVAAADRPAPDALDALDLSRFMNAQVHAFFDEAEPAVALARVARESQRDLHGERSKEYVTALVNSGYAAMAQGEHAQAEAWFRQALEIQDGLVGPGSFEGLGLLNSLGWALIELGRGNEAEACFRRLLDDARVLFPDGHMAVANGQYGLATTLAGRGERAQAKELLREAVATWIDVAGEQHFGTSTAMNKLGWLLYEDGELAEAEDLARRALAVDRALVDDDTTQVASDLKLLAFVLGDLGRYAEAREVHEQILEQNAERYGEESGEVGWTLHSLGQLSRHLGELDRASGELAESVRVLELAGDDALRADGLVALGQVELESGRLDEAVAALGEALVLGDRVWDPSNPRAVVARILLAQALAATDRLAEARPLLEQAIDRSRGHPDRTEYGAAARNMIEQLDGLLDGAGSGPGGER